MEKTMPHVENHNGLDLTRLYSELEQEELEYTLGVESTEEEVERLYRPREEPAKLPKIPRDLMEYWRTIVFREYVD